MSQESEQFQEEEDEDNITPIGPTLIETLIVRPPPSPCSLCLVLP
jgi:hypothetical protein